MTQNRRRRPRKWRPDGRQVLALLPGILRAGLPLADTQELVEEALLAAGIGATGAHLASMLSSPQSPPAPGAGPAEASRWRMSPLWLSAHVIAMARGVEATYETYYVDGELGEWLAMSTALRSERMHLRRHIEATRRRKERAKTIDRGIRPE